MRVVFMGTPDIAATCLQRLIGEEFDLVGGYTKPDKPKKTASKREKKGNFDKFSKKKH